jgi:2,3,4,5-tetrahydropyridine-2-carboxylate N-succinyltransferase/tetrahydrodipicolinate N-acetyltransferase
VLVSANAVVLRGTRIGMGAVVAANAVCNGGEVPAGWLAAGAPARPLRALTPADG